MSGEEEMLMKKSMNGSRSQRKGKVMSFGIGIFGRSRSMMLMGHANRRIIGRRLGEVGLLPNCLDDAKINQGARGSMMKLLMSIICIFSLHSSPT